MTNEKVLQIIEEAAKNNSTHLDLSGNQLIQLPLEIKKLERLTHLDLSKNGLYEMPAEITKLQNLIQLDLSNNTFTGLPLEITKLHNLTKLDMSENALLSLSPEITELNNLEQLNLSGNDFRHLSLEIMELRNLKQLDVSRNFLTRLPPEIAKLKNLTHLDLSGNELRQLPLEIGQLQNLKTLSLSSNQLRQLPSEITQLQKLTTLDLSINQLAQLSQEIGQLQNLKTFDLSANELTRLPPEIGQLQNLTAIFIPDNQLTQLPVEITQLQKLTTLDLSDNQLTQLPLGISQLQNLETLLLSRNKLTPLPIEINQLQNLKTLYFSGNQLVQIPPGINQLQNLTALFLSSNQLTQLPIEITQLQKLTTLDLSDNQLTQLPIEITQLQNLTTLDLSDNQLKQLPREVSKLRNLKRFKLSKNKLTQLPLEIFKLPLDVKCELDYSDSIILKDNPIEIPPIDIIQRGKKAVIEYFESLEKGDNKPLSEVKVLLVGDGGAGKTSLIKRLLDGEFDQNEPQTHGINIQNWKIKLKNEDIKVNIWDFGGQEIMHSTHQFFLSKRSLYILLLDSRKDEKTEYWLKHIEIFGGDSPILVAINKIDENRSFDVNRKFLKEKYPSVKDFYQISCKTREGIENFATNLKENLGKIEHIHTTWPKSWFNVKSKLESMNEHFISYDKYKQLCDEEGVSEEARNILVDFLNDLGVVLHFNDLELLDTHVLEPKWVTNAVYKIINSKDLSNTNGVLILDQLRSILRKEKDDDFYYSIDKFKYIIELMKKFELCYSVDNQTVLIPELLEIRQPDFDFNDKKALRFLISYTELLPKSVMPRFIVKMNQDIKDNLMWRTGVVLENHALKSSAMVKSDADARKIYIAVNGEQQRDYFAVILNNLRTINNSFTNLSVIERVPLPDNPTITVSYVQLIDYELMGESTIIPEGTRKRYSVRELLGNVFVENIIETKIPGDIVMRDKYVYSAEQVIGAQGQNVQATVNIQNFNQIWQENKDVINLAKLSDDLAKLKAAIKQEAESSEQFESLTNVVHAQEAAANNNGPKTLEYLSKAGKWALGIARDIGVEIAATALSKSLGLN